jgi:GNAT superfamily N-acetyltransferase
MRIERRQAGDEDVAAACHDVWLAARGVDDPEGMPRSPRFFRAWLEHGYEGYPGELWVVPGPSSGAGGSGALGGSGGSGRPGLDAWCHLGLPDREDLTVAAVRIVVRPGARRRGLGTGLLRHAADRARALGRTLLAAEAEENSAGEAFAGRVKATRGHTLVRRVLDLTAVPPGQLARLRDEAAAHSAGYSLVRWRDATPDSYRGRIAAVYEAMNDAPRDPGREAAAWDADRVRRDDAITAAFGCRGYQVAAVHDATGDIAAFTGLLVDPEYPAWGLVTITAVTGPHRGHRLGLGVKIAAQAWAASAEPALRWIETDNAAVNRHMIAVNEALGYRIHEPGMVSYELPVEDVPPE